MGRALALVRYLRAHCDWDARQTPESLLPYLLEEAHEVAEAVRRRGRAAEDGTRSAEEALAAELGDLLLNVAFQLVLAEERGDFGVGDVVAELERKMIARHPHVYGDAEAPPDWEGMKARERAVGHPRGPDEAPGGPSARDPLAGIPAGLEPLSRALRIQERASGLGFDWPDASGALEKLREEVEELEAVLAQAGSRKTASPSSAGTPPPAEVADEAGDLLFAAVNVCRLAGVHPDGALSGATEKFATRFRRVAERARAEGLDLRAAGLEALDRIWDGVKAEEDGRTLSG
ncbi:MAG: nucleoside triphosphate pyrophosphohydrolase [Gemmatimonadota bacterium]